jgi:hypothetical protein
MSVPTSTSNMLCNLRASHRCSRVTESYRSPELAVARFFVEDVMAHLRTGRLNSILVEIRDSRDLTSAISECPPSVGCSEHRSLASTKFARCQCHETRTYQGMTRSTVVTFVVVVDQGLPITPTIHVPDMIKLKLFFEIELLHLRNVSRAS